jgi:hypothetical protein
MRHLISLSLVLLAACNITPPPPRSASMPRSAPYPPACAVRFAPNPNLAAWSADTITGTYRSGRNAITVRREGSNLIVEQPHKLATQITRGDAQSWTFRDGCGTRYQFVLPPDGRGARLTVTVAAGVATHWNRSGD